MVLVHFADAIYLFTFCTTDTLITAERHLRRRHKINPRILAKDKSYIDTELSEKAHRHVKEYYQATHKEDIRWQIL